MITVSEFAGVVASRAVVRLKLGESRLRYLARARVACHVAVDRLRETGGYRGCHVSFVVCDALKVVEHWFPDLGTFGVEHVPAGQGSKSPAISYLNTGDLYDHTLLHVNGRFRVGCVGCLVERGRYD